MSGVLILSALASAKDTAGTVLNPMSKLVNLVSVNIAAIVVQYSGAQGSAVIVVWVVALALLGVLARAVMRSKMPTPALPDTKFVFVHILPPHAPFVFHADGAPLDPGQKFWFGHAPGLTKEQQRQYDLAQIEFVNSQIESAVETILEKSETTPIMLLQADG